MKYLYKSQVVTASNKEEAIKVLAETFRKIPGTKCEVSDEGKIVKITENGSREIKEIVSRNNDRHKPFFNIPLENGNTDRRKLEDIMKEVWPEKIRIIGKEIPETNGMLSMDKFKDIYTIGFKPVKINSKGDDKGRLEHKGIRFNIDKVYKRLFPDGENTSEINVVLKALSNAYYVDGNKVKLDSNHSLVINSEGDYIVIDWSCLYNAKDYSDKKFKENDSNLLDKICNFLRKLNRVLLALKELNRT